MTAAELLYGVSRLPAGRRKQVLTGIVASRERLGEPISVADAQLAAIRRQYDLALATRNVKDFAGIAITIVNPWE